jgi:hypothetical protein
MSIVNTWGWENIKPIEEDYEVPADEKLQAALWNFECAIRVRPNRITIGYNLAEELRRKFSCAVSSKSVYEYEGIPVAIDYNNPNIIEVRYVMKLWD